VNGWLGLAACIVGCQAVGALGGMVTRPSLDGWYANLRKPSFNPPNWAFPIAWTTLFLAMAVALWLVIRGEPSDARSLGLVLFGVQLALNFLWSWLFFGQQSPGWALLELGVFWGVLVATMATFFQVAPPAGWLLVPYVAWVSFAAVLNFELWRLNRSPA